ncbi:MAG: ArsR/SmtB family transcription factor [Pseudomonadota bacterium]
MNLLKIMKALGDETRLRIVNLLNKGELCVCELEHLLDINQSNASRHLNRLTEADIIFFEKRALYVYYSINGELYEEFPLLVEFLDKELGKLDKCRLDMERLSAYKASGISCEELKAGKMCFSNKEV